jgi:putative ABC transport system substrate-binding protein
MRRRQFITLIGGAAAAWPLTAGAQQPLSKIPVVGVLWHGGSAQEEEVYLSVLVKAFNDLGYVEGKNIHLDHRFPAETPERFRVLLVLNLKTAKALGVTFPQTLIVSADEVIGV